MDEKCLNSCRKNDFLYVFAFFFTKLNYQYKVLSKVSSLSPLIFKNQPRIVLSMSFNFFKISDLCFYRNCLIKKCIHIFRYFYTRLLSNFVIFWKNIVKDPNMHNCWLLQCTKRNTEISDYYYLRFCSYSLSTFTVFGIKESMQNISTVFFCF